MSFRFPSFADSRCVGLRACGNLMTKDKGILKWLREQEELRARYRAQDRTGAVLVGTGGTSGNTVHIDVAMPGFFRRGLPKATHKVSEVRKALKRLYGLEIDVGITGRFYVGLQELPPVITSMIADTTAGDVSLRTIAGTFAVTGAPIFMIDWRIRESRNDVRVDLDAAATLKIDDDYLNICLALVEPAFNELILNVADR